MTSALNPAAEHLIDELAHADESAILQRLDAELQRQATATAAVLSADPHPGVLGGEESVGSTAQRFLRFYTDAIHREICDAEKGRLKDHYRGTIGGETTAEQVKSLVPTLLAALGIGASFVNPAAIASLVALWLVRVGLDQWCAAPRSAPAEAGSGAAPVRIDPSVVPPAAAASSDDLLSDLLTAPLDAQTATPADNLPPARADLDSAGAGTAPMPVDPSVSTAPSVTDTTPDIADSDVRIEPASTSSNPDVRGE